jgi:HlyD family secretion protein
MRLRWTITSVLGATVLLAPLYGGWEWLGQNPVSAAGALPDRAENAKAVDNPRGSASFQLAARGRIEPVSEELELAIGLVGSLAAVYVDEGDPVKQGQLLAELVNRDQWARVTQAEAQQRLRQAELEKLLHGARPEERRQAVAQVEKTEAGVALARQELARRRSLAATGVSSQQALEQAVSSVHVADANDNATRAALELINAPPRGEDVAIAQANLALAEANLDEQRALFQKTQLRSPIEGVVLRRYLKTGETISVQPLIPILQVGDPRRLRVRAEIDETEVGQLELGRRAWAIAPAYSGRRFGGVIARVGQRMGRKTVRSDEPTEKNDTNVLDVLIDLDDPGVRLPIGLRVNVFVEPSSSGIAKN